MKNEKNRKLKGSVLLTVVFVMAILIVFMFGTLSLALSASNRSHVNYSSAQTSVTARAVAESAIKAISNNSENGKAYATAVANLKDRNSLEVGVQLSSDTDGPLAMGDVSNVLISHIGTTDFYDPVTNRWETRDVLKFTANVEMAGVISTSSVYVVKHYDKDTKTDTGGGAGFVTTAGAVLKTQTSIFGGSYVGLPELSKARTYNYSGNYDERMASRTFRIVDAEGKTTEDLELYNSAAVLEADVYVNNDVSIENWSGFVFPKTGTGITILGDLTFSENVTSHLKYIMVNRPSGDINFKDIPYLYVDGKIKGRVNIGPSGSTPEEKFPFNTFCSSIEVTSDNGGWINSNLYCMDEGLDSIIKKNVKHSTLYTWADSTINKIESKKRDTAIGGEICTMGNLTLDVGVDEGLVIKGDLRVKGDLTIKGKVIVEGDVAVGGNITGTILTERPGTEQKDGLYATGSIYCDNLDANTEKAELEIPNKKGYYYVYDPTIRTVDGVTGYTYCNGEFIQDNHIENGVPNETLPESIPKIYHTMNENEFPNPDANGIETDVTGYRIGTDYFYDGVSHELDQYKFTDEEGNPCFYCETKVVDFRESDGFTDGYEVIKIGDTEYKYRLKTNYYTKVTSPTSKHMVSIGGSLQKYLDKIGEDEVYPEYATRKAVLAYPGSGYNEDTKIVKTLEDVLTGVADPYKQVLPDGMKSSYNSAPEYTSAEALYKEQGVAVTLNEAETLASKGAKIEKISDEPLVYKEYTFNGTTYYHVTKGTYTDQDWANATRNYAAFIDRSCKLNGVTFAKDVIIDPGKSNIVVGVGSESTVTFQSGGKVFVDDDESGKVYFYIDKNSTLHFAGNPLLTRSYWNLFGSTKNVSYNCDVADCTRIDKLEKIGDYAFNKRPNVHVYGTTGSNLKIENFDVMTMYVKSPEISAEISGGTGNMCDSFYYNGYDAVKLVEAGTGKTNIGQLLIGCFNAKEAKDIKNQFVNIFISEDGGDEPIAVDSLNNFWYRPYYYSEF